ncbi:unnamed protein product [Mytilus coruscus]|uniref:ZSWIM1/3 RNaseH-like domain-containing protein n=1 Tax=Mytilus coruscus TaxID=42192 RepID=A0A6J8F4M3_MYTCO|nr:unnamed protein product [Mytilus coruscus]
MSSSFRKGYPAYISVGVSEDGKFLVVKSIEDNHNHEISKVTNGSVVEVCRDFNNQVQGVFYQDNEMQKILSAYCDIVFVDATYNLNDLRMPLYVIMTEDSLEQSEVAAICLLNSDERPVLQHLIKCFQKHNPDSSGIKVVMANTNIVERDVFKEAFPDASLLICKFDVSRAFNREITTEKIGISSAQRYVALEPIQKLVHITSQEVYKANLKLIETTEEGWLTVESVLRILEDQYLKQIKRKEFPSNVSQKKRKGKTILEKNCFPTKGIESEGNDRKRKRDVPDLEDNICNDKDGNITFFPDVMETMQSMRGEIMEFIKMYDPKKVPLRVGNTINTVSKYHDGTRSLSDDQRDSITQYLCTFQEVRSLSYIANASLIPSLIEFIIKRKTENDLQNSMYNI